MTINASNDFETTMATKNYRVSDNKKCFYIIIVGHFVNSPLLQQLNLKDTKGLVREDILAGSQTEKQLDKKPHHYFKTKLQNEATSDNEEHT